MAGGFQVANFDFGQNIEKNAIERQRIAASSALQARGQDIQREQANATREEGARQFDEQMADRQAQREDAAAAREAEMAERQAQREEGARQFDQNMALKERDQSWDEALKQQQMKAEDAKFQKWSADLENLLAEGQRDREEYEKKVQAQKDLRESALGMVSEGVLLSGPMGGFTPSQVKMFNEKFGQQFDCIGRRNALTGEEYDDGLIHLVQYQKDDNGNVMFGFQDASGKIVQDPQRQNPNSQPLVLRDQTISKEDYQIGLGRLREYGGRALKGSSGGDGLEIARINADQKEKDRQSRSDKLNREMEFKERKFQYGVSKDMAKEAKDFFSTMSEEDKASFKAKYPEMAKQILGMSSEAGADDGSGGGSDKGDIKPGDNNGNEPDYKEGDEVEQDGVRYRLLPSKKDPGKLTWQRI